jgi:hypothetical protein
LGICQLWHDPTGRNPRTDTPKVVAHAQQMGHDKGLGDTSTTASLYYTVIELLLLLG